MHELTIRIRLGPSAADQRDQTFEADTLISDLITYCKKDYRLPEQNASGEMIRYVVYRDQGSAKEKLDKSRSLRMLRIQPFEVLYLTDERRIWWQGSSPPRPMYPGNIIEPRADERPRTSPSSIQGSTSTSLPVSVPLRPVGGTSCLVELAPGCVRQVPEAGQIINRDYLIQQLPISVSARERALVLIGLKSRLEAVSRDIQGHCTLVYRQGWYLLAHHTVYIGSNRHSHGEALPLDQTVTLLLGRDGWPITIRLHSSLIMH